MKKFFALILATGCAFSCSERNEEPFFGNGRISVEPLITRATEVNFESGDKIGLTVTRTDGSAWLSNIEMTYADGLFAGTAVWYDGSETSTLKAYYPYAAGGLGSSFAVAEDQSGDGYAASDLMTAVKEGVQPSASAISMLFRHRMARIVINTENNTGGTFSAVKLTGAVADAVVDDNLEASAAPGGPKTDITAKSVAVGEKYMAIVVPQSMAVGLSVTLADGKEVKGETGEITYEPGCSYSLKANVTADGIKISVSGEIEDWEDKGEIPGAGAVEFEDHPDEEYFIYDGDRYKTVTLDNGQRWMAQPMHYLPEGMTPSADAKASSHVWYPYELKDVTEKITAGSAEALTDKESIEALGYLYDTYAALGGVEVTVDNCNSFEGAKGICPDGWHIPTRDELIALCGNSNWGPQDAPVASPTQKIDKSALFWNETYNGAVMGSYNDAGWNYVMSGVRMQNGFAASGSYQLTTLYSGNTSSSTPREYFGKPALNYMLSSTCYKPIYKTGAEETPENLNNIQFFAQMTTFSSVYPLGRINVAYNSILSGGQLRCVKNN